MPEPFNGQEKFILMDDYMDPLSLLFYRQTRRPNVVFILLLYIYMYILHDSQMAIMSLIIYNVFLTRNSGGGRYAID